MSAEQFEPEFQELFTALVEIAFEFVEHNDKEIEKIFIYASMEDNNLFYNVFYKINGQLVQLHDLNKVLQKKCDLSDTRTFNLLNTGSDFLEQILDLFEEHNRPVPTLMKMTFEPKSKAFNNDISYDLQYSNDDERTNADGFQEWFEKIKSLG
jgi:hypothetical protein